MHPATSTYTHTVNDNQTTETSIADGRYTFCAQPMRKANGGCPFSIKKVYENSKFNGVPVGDGRYTISAEPLPKAPGGCPSQKELHRQSKHGL